MQRPQQSVPGPQISCPTLHSARRVVGVMSGVPRISLRQFAGRFHRVLRFVTTVLLGGSRWPQRETGTTAMSRLDAIVDWVEKAKIAHYKVKELARLCDISTSQLERHFAKTFGKSSQHWLNDLRLCHAAQLLCCGISAKEVHRRLHFSDPQTFNRQFKRFYGCTPGKFGGLYRRREHDEIEQLRACFGEDFPRTLLALPPWEVVERNLCHQNPALDTAKN
jgi:AraC-like DNA-binding protein